MNSQKSLPGRYAGYDEPRYADSSQSSFYIESGDGTRLAVDLVLPQPLAEGETLPTILIVSRNGRYDPVKGNGDALATPLIACGYALVVAELRGCGASFGTNDSFGDYDHVQDAMAVIQWIGQQPWSNGKVGMMGISNRSYMQLCTAAYGPEGLTAVTPTVAITDFYYQNYPNGVSAVPVRKMSQLPTDFTPHKLTKEELLQAVRPVDNDPEGDLAYQAYESGQFGKNKPFTDALLHANMNRDTPNPVHGGRKTNLEIPPLFRFREGKAGHIRQHQFIGQLESGTLGQLAHYKEQGGSFVMGPWNHFQSRLGNPAVPEGMMDFTAEYHRYFDAVLKGLDNGFDQAPPVCYYVFNAKEGTNWRYADSWPLSTERRATFYLDGGPTGTCPSVNDGILSQQKPGEEAWDEYRVRTDISVFDNNDGKGSTFSRMNLAWDGDMAEGVDQKGLTYTTPPLFPVYDNQMAGCVSVDLWVTCDQPDADFIVYLEEVLPDGTSHYIKDGLMRASHRTSAPNTAWESLGATWHTSMTEDVDRCLAEGMEKPVHLQFAIDPIVYCFRKNSRIRLTITCANKAACQHPYDEENLPTVRLYRGGDHASFISVPFVEHTETTYNGQVSMEGYTGPGTLYFLDEHIYLYAGGAWKKMKADAPEAQYTMCGTEARFAAGFTFQVQGPAILDGIIQDFQGSDAPFQPLPAFRQKYLDTVPIEPRPDRLFVPTVKTLTVNLFHPDSAGQKAPCILFLHGYGQTNGTLTAPILEFYKNGYAIAGIDLRNYPSNYFPDYIQDVKGGIRYLRAHAEELNIQAERLGCYGHSLGGNSTLMAAVSGGEEALEGTVGGNLAYSSRLQAAACGFAWSDVLYMGADIAEEYAGEPDMIREKFQRTDGEFAPCAEPIGFAGPGKGMAVLRRYLQEGKVGTDPEMDRMLQKARDCSPLYHITPAAPPLSIFGGYGMRRVDIAMKQSLRTFERLHACDVTAFLFANTQGDYGLKPEIIHANLDFFNRWLREEPREPKLAADREKKELLATYRESDAPVIWEETVLLPAGLVEETFGVSVPEELCETRNGSRYLPETALKEVPGLVYQDFPACRMFTVKRG